MLPGLADKPDQVTQLAGVASGDEGGPGNDGQRQRRQL